MANADSGARIKELEERVANLQASRPLCCYDCGRRYDKGPDLIVSDENWAKIAPHDGQGVLCPNCMHDRFVALGVPAGSVQARFVSGPFADCAFVEMMGCIETFESLGDSLAKVERYLAYHLGLTAGDTRAELLRLAEANNLDEDDPLVEEWLALYSSFSDWKRARVTEALY